LPIFEASAVAYVRTLFQHERIKSGALDHDPDRACAAALLASINASAVSLLRVR